MVMGVQSPLSASSSDAPVSTPSLLQHLLLYREPVVVDNRELVGEGTGALRAIVHWNGRSLELVGSAKDWPRGEKIGGEGGNVSVRDAH